MPQSRTVKAVPHLARPTMALLALLAMTMLTACASGPRRAPGLPDAATLGERIAATALAQLGKPYRYGGNGPAAFDCSGLVRFAHAAHGVAVPRTTGDQFGAATPIPEQQLAPGDLLFFRFEAGPKVTHVAIYTGDGRFVHAPQGGRNVERGRLADPWFRQRLAGTGRLH